VNELAPIPGLEAPNFLAAKLVYKMLATSFGARSRQPMAEAYLVFQTE